MFRSNGKHNIIAERIQRFFVYGHRHPAPDYRSHFAGCVDRRSQPSVCIRHPQARRNFRPTLVHVRGATTEIRFEPKQIGLRAVGRPGALAEAASDLIWFLVVLMRPHVVRQRPGQGVIGDLFQAVAQSCTAKNSQTPFERKHLLDHRAQLNSLRRIRARQVFVRAEHTIGNPMMPVERVKLLLNTVAIAILLREKPPQRG